jgi:hypothetical protein
MHFTWASLDQAEQYCTHNTQFASCLFTQCLAFNPIKRGGGHICPPKQKIMLIAPLRSKERAETS